MKKGWSLYEIPYGLTYLYIYLLRPKKLNFIVIVAINYQLLLVLLLFIIYLSNSAFFCGITVVMERKFFCKLIFFQNDLVIYFFFSCSIRVCIFFHLCCFFHQFFQKKVCSFSFLISFDTIIGYWLENWGRKHVIRIPSNWKYEC